MEQLLLFIYLYFIDGNWQLFDMNHIYWIWIHCMFERVYIVTKGRNWEFRKRLWFEEWSSREYLQQTLLECNSCVLLNRSILVENGSQWFPFWGALHIPMPWMDFIFITFKPFAKNQYRKMRADSQTLVVFIVRNLLKGEITCNLQCILIVSVMPVYYLLYKKCTQLDSSKKI